MAANPTGVGGHEQGWAKTYRRDQWWVGPAATAAGPICRSEGEPASCRVVRSSACSRSSAFSTPGCLIHRRAVRTVSSTTTRRAILTPYSRSSRSVRARFSSTGIQDAGAVPEPLEEWKSSIENRLGMDGRGTHSRA